MTFRRQERQLVGLCLFFGGVGAVFAVALVIFAAMSFQYGAIPQSNSLSGLHEGQTIRIDAVLNYPSSQLAVPYTCQSDGSGDTDCNLDFPTELSVSVGGDTAVVKMNTNWSQVGPLQQAPYYGQQHLGIVAVVTILGGNPTLKAVAVSASAGNFVDTGWEFDIAVALGLTLAGVVVAVKLHRSRLAKAHASERALGEDPSGPTGSASSSEDRLWSEIGAPPALDLLGTEPGRGPPVVGAAHEVRPMTPEERHRIAAVSRKLKYAAVGLDVVTALFVALFVEVYVAPWNFSSPGVLIQVGYVGGFVVGFFAVPITYLIVWMERDRRRILADHVVNLVGGRVALKILPARFGGNTGVTEMHLSLAGLDFWLGQTGATNPSPGDRLFNQLHDGEVVNMAYASDDRRRVPKGSGWILSVNGIPTPEPVWMAWKPMTGWP